MKLEFHDTKDVKPVASGKNQILAYWDRDPGAAWEIVLYLTADEWVNVRDTEELNAPTKWAYLTDEP